MDNTLFSCLTHNPQPLHIDRHFCETETEFGQPLMNSLFTLGLMIGISVNDTTLGTTIANLGMTEVKFPHPLFHGDTVHVRTTCARQARKPLAARRRHRRIPARGVQSGRHAGGGVQAAGVHAQAAGGIMSGDEEKRARPPRSLLFVPGNDERKLEKALASGADMLLIDLEDSVALRGQGGRPADRRRVPRRSRAGRRASPALCARQRPADRPDACTISPRSCPRARTASCCPRRIPARDVATLARLMDRGRWRGGADHAGIIGIATETPLALLQMHSFVGAEPRLRGMTWGAEDLGTAIGAATAREPSGEFTGPFALARNLCLIARPCGGRAGHRQHLCRFPRRAPAWNARRARRPATVLPPRWPFIRRKCRHQCGFHAEPRADRRGERHRRGLCEASPAPGRSASPAGWSTGRICCARKSCSRGSASASIQTQAAAGVGVKLMQSKKASALAHERSECVSRWAAQSVTGICAAFMNMPAKSSLSHGGPAGLWCR